MFVVCAFSAAPVAATVTIHNTASTLAGTQAVVLTDIVGNAVDAHDGDMLQVGSTFYLYGTSYGCGYRWLTSSTFCGFKVYSSTDLVTWTDQGYIFDASGATWQTRCVLTTGCFRPHMIYNAANNNYVLWINSYDSGTSGGNLRVFTCTSPVGGCTEQALPTVGAGASGDSNGDFGLFVDDDGTAYIIVTRFTAPGSGHAIYVQQLTSTYLNATGSPVAIGVSAPSEAPALTKQGSTYFAIYGPTCPFCGGTATIYKTATSPLGSWSAETQINATSCGGQPAFTRKLTIAGSPVYLFGSDVWQQTGASGGIGNVNQGTARFFWQVLTVGSGAISSFACDATVDIAGLTAVPNPSDPRVDQTSGASGYAVALATSIYNLTNPRVQSFVAGANEALATVTLLLAQGGVPCAAGSCTPPDQGVSIDLVTIDGSGKPTAVLRSVSIPTSQIAWAPRRVWADFAGYPLTNGATYGIRVSSSYTVGAYALLYNDSAVYPSGTEYVSSNSGSSYSAESGRSLSFAILRFVRGVTGPATVTGPVTIQ